MVRVDDTNYSNALEVLSQTFSDNPALIWLIGKNRITPTRMMNLCRYCLDISIAKEGAYITSDGHGVALIYHNRKKPSFFRNIRLHVALIHRCIGWHRIHHLIRREMIVGKTRSKEEGMYCLMIAARRNPNGVKTVAEIKNEMFSMTESLNLPLFAETSTDGNKKLYERFALREYATCVLPGADFKLYFMKRPVSGGTTAAPAEKNPNRTLHGA